MSRVSNAMGPYIQSGRLNRFIPEPLNGLANTFGSLLGSLSKGASSLMGGFPGVDSTYQPLLDTQVKIQEQMLRVSLYSNIEKSKHETEMSAVRNIRVG